MTAERIKLQIHLIYLSLAKVHLFRNALLSLLFGWNTANPRHWVFFSLLYSLVCVRMSGNDVCATAASGAKQINLLSRRLFSFHFCLFAFLTANCCPTRFHFFFISVVINTSQYLRTLIEPIVLNGLKYLYIDRIKPLLIFSIIFFHL